MRSIFTSVAVLLVLVACGERRIQVRCVCHDETTTAASPGGGGEPVDSHRISVAHHESIDYPMSHAAGVLKGMGDILDRDDDGAGTKDLSCDCTFSLEGEVGSFSTTDGYVYGPEDYAALRQVPSFVKVVNDIYWCGSHFAFGVFGCADSGGRHIVVRTKILPQRESSLWLHEFGHTRGLPHRDDEDAVMRSWIGGANWRVMPDECNHLRRESP